MHNLSHGQKSLWLTYQIAQDSAAYNVFYTARIRSAIDGNAFRLAFKALIIGHSVLRTHYPVINGEPFQEIYGYQKACFEEIDASSWSWAELERRVVDA